MFPNQFFVADFSHYLHHESSVNLDTDHKTWSKSFPIYKKIIEILENDVGMWKPNSMEIQQTQKSN